MQNRSSLVVHLHRSVDHGALLVRVESERQLANRCPIAILILTSVSKGLQEPHCRLEACGWSPPHQNVDHGGPSC